MKQMTLRDKVVIYHAGCIDGMGAAASFQHWVQQSLKNGDDRPVSVAVNPHIDRFIKIDTQTSAQLINYSGGGKCIGSCLSTSVLYVPAVYDKDYSNLVALDPERNQADYFGDNVYLDYYDKEVFIVDFSLPRSQLEKICETAHSVTVLDHHHTAFKAYEDWDEAERPNNLVIELAYGRSGATQTWWWLMENEDYPRVIQHVEDRDLWKWNIPNTKEFSLAVYNGNGNYMKSVSLWGGLLDRYNEEEYEDAYHDLIDKGSKFAEYQEMSIRKHMRYARTVKLSGGLYEVPVVNVTRDITSEILESLILEHRAPFAIAFIDGPKERWWSLRSKFGTEVDFKTVDVSEIAEILGGGGHQAASGFTTPHYVAPEMLDKWANTVMQGLKEQAFKLDAGE
ncbi:hypothetical protein GR11A_00203 [Vibrio phage vB_VcorM_GR11A]|nr:hypothetical protein GR11A_00203 [Vibrio phage vB_VcorM_GR11A]